MSEDIKRIGRVAVRNSHRITGGGLITDPLLFEVVIYENYTKNPECIHGGYTIDGVKKDFSIEKYMNECDIPKETCYVLAFIDYTLCTDELIQLVGRRVFNLCKSERDIAFDFIDEYSKNIKC